MTLTYWLVNSGTTANPLKPHPGAVRAAFMNWDSRWGPVHGLDRAYGMQPGDVLIYRSVGTAVSRLVAAGTVLSSPEEKPVSQWPCRVRRKITALVPTLRDAPPFDVLETAPVRMTKRLDGILAATAVELIAAAAQNPRSGHP